MSEFAAETRIDAPIEKVWQALADIGDIHQWNPGVIASHTISEVEEGTGTARYCNLGGKNFLEEEVVAWKPNEQLTMRIVNTNMPFAAADIRFYLRPENGATAVTVSPKYRLKWGPVGALMDRFYVRKTYRRGMQSLLEGLKQFVEKGQPA